MAKKKQTEQTIEAALLRLQSIVDEMEQSATPLEQALALYKEGVLLSQFCAEQLNVAESQVVTLKQTSEGNFILKPFEGN